MSVRGALRVLRSCTHGRGSPRSELDQLDEAAEPRFMSYVAFPGADEGFNVIVHTR